MTEGPGLAKMGPAPNVAMGSMNPDTSSAMGVSVMDWKMGCEVLLAGVP
jgi:hypothetical protein